MAEDSADARHQAPRCVRVKITDRITQGRNVDLVWEGSDLVWRFRPGQITPKYETDVNLASRYLTPGGMWDELRGVGGVGGLRVPRVRVVFSRNVPDYLAAVPLRWGSELVWVVRPGEMEPACAAEVMELFNDAAWREPWEVPMAWEGPHRC